MSTGRSSMNLNRANARWLGVCAGIADWLDVPPVLVRVIFVICAISWPTLILGYFILYFCLDRDITPDAMRNFFNDNSPGDHFSKIDYRKPIYKNESNKRIWGVCSGIADYLEVSAFSVRLVTLLSLFIFGPFTFWAYIICCFVFDPDPNTTPKARQQHRMHRRQAKAERKERRAQRKAARRTRKSYVNEAHRDDDAQTSQDSESSSFESETSFQDDDLTSSSRSECAEIFSALETRLRDMEAYMTSKKFRLHCEINRI